MRTREYFRGCYHGYAAALELTAKYGRAFVQRGALDLEANLRKRSETHTDFDRGYTHAYRAVADEQPHASETHIDTPQPTAKES
jgi:hypothetical protein